MDIVTMLDPLTPKGGIVDRLATWDAADTTSGARTGTNGWPAFDAVIGGWVAIVFWLASNTTGAARYIISDGTAVARGFALFLSTTGIATWRVANAAGAAVDVTTSIPTIGKFNAMILELDIGSGIIAATLNNGTRQTSAIVGHTVTNASDRFALDNRQTLSTGFGTDGGVHAIAGAGSDVITAAQRTAFWGSYALLEGMGDYGDPPGGVESLGNPLAEHKWVAHDLACKMDGTLLTKAGTVNDRFHPAEFAF